ncbi:MAG: beta-ketoacyl synthase N-terminal-like domain-containing protein, partial [Planctomycetota bacterium]
MTGVGLTSPNGNDLQTYRKNLLAGVSGVSPYEIRYFGATVAGQCDYDAKRYQTRKSLRRGTRAGSIAIYCANEALQSAGVDLETAPKDRIGVYVGTTEHGNVETEQQIYEISQYDYD